jgi:OOP family OmpA-OmpF porin
MSVRPSRGITHRGIAQRFTQIALAALVVAALAARADAQLTNAPVDLQIFRPAMDSKGFITLNSSGVLALGDLSFGLVTTWASKPLTLNAPAGSMPAGNRFQVGDIVTPSLQAAVGLTKLSHFGLELGIVVPMAILAGRGDPTERGIRPDSSDDKEWTFTKQGLGDIILHPKIRFMNATRNGIGLAVIPSVVLPTGDKNAFLGEGQTIFQPSVVIDSEVGYLGRFRATINAGMRIRGHNSVFVENAMSFPRTFMGAPVNTNQGISVGTEYNGGVGLSYGIVPQTFDVVAELYGLIGPNSTKIPTNEKLGPAAEAIGGIKLYMARNSFFEVGGGWRVLSSYGSAAPRAFIGFIFEPSIGDRDGDGYKDDVDKCPDDPEDFDDFEDSDGCPDPDNDKDGILDVDDKCPNDPETKNGFQDEDGCPDSLNLDRDGDGIPDDVDKCPDQPEDKDGFEDEDGCPDPDNDKDGILDINDLCPNVPEDKDGFEDEDGCPDPDNDKDRILDINDKCPNEPETYNGVDDDDGCPDKGKVIVRKGKLEILDKIYFETDKTDIKPESFPLLDAIAATIKGNPQIQLIEIQGHADERGNDEHNLELTEGRSMSVRRALEQRGVEGGRLKNHGYGETKPLCTAHNEDCWSKNRRVEFIILRRSDEAHLQGGEGQ